MKDLWSLVTLLVFAVHLNAQELRPYAIGASSDLPVSVLKDIVVNALTDQGPYGFGMNDADGEKCFMPKIDIGEHKYTAFLPLEVLVKGNEVIMLHGRYRNAVAFPDLTMATFTKIKFAPEYIEDALEKVVIK